MISASTIKASRPPVQNLRKMESRPSGEGKRLYQHYRPGPDEFAVLEKVSLRINIRQFADTNFSEALSVSLQRVGWICKCAIRVPAAASPFSRLNDSNLI